MAWFQRLGSSTLVSAGDRLLAFVLRWLVFLYTYKLAPWAIFKSCSSPTVPLPLGWLLAAAGPSHPRPQCSRSVIGNLATVSEPSVNDHRVSTLGLTGHIQTLLPIFFSTTL